MRILVVGAGATGGYFGGRLMQAGRDVTFLVRPARAEKLRTEGLRIVSPFGNAELAPKLVTTGDIAETYDLVLLTVKAYGLEAALDDIAPAIASETMILPVLNGMRHVDVIKARFGEKALLGGVCLIAATIDGEERIVQLTPMHNLIYGEMSGERSERIKALDATMQGAGFNAKLSDDIERDMWGKWITLASLGGICCLMRGSVGEIEAAPGGLAFVLRFFDEVVSVVKAVGKLPGAPILDMARAMLTQKGSAMASSMYRDLQKGAPIEADQIIGDLLTRAQEAGIETPLLSAAYTNLAIYQAR
ncbi:2-dehydropantoate 2-reductase [Labrys okinawensis]|uniref:2-dehydropantoate 2-reductase n=1 Tax=Labrys okinawensis TaxID=346911 RepID=A0A2S9Q553_9HYPH|nr:2-dehydropantoate 2-reductase [Labrys okinawensis]PRH84450.1 2-dehydropantoate 2-reductase [Labrys okinawensis]